MKKINLSFFMLLIVLFQVIITDTIIFFSKLAYIPANVIALVINALIWILLIKKKWIKIENTFKKWDLVFFIMLVAVIIFSIFFIDWFWDSYSYHIYLQENPFTDKINADFMPGRALTSFVFPIVDRIFYAARYALGFRLGTLPGYLILIVMFYQCKKILKALLKDDIKEGYLSILSFMPILTFVILQQLGSYYIDNFSVVLILEFVYVVLTETEGLFKNKSCLYYLAGIVGIAVCIKITNAVFMVGPLLYVLIKNIKDIKYIKWYDYFLLIVAAILPMLPYLLTTIIQTGSPVFPYYNTVFKSKYYDLVNWSDKRYGPKDIGQFIFWPIFIFFNPNKAYEYGTTDICLAIGYFIAIIYLVYMAYKKFIKKNSNVNTNINSDNNGNTSNIMIKYCLILLYLYIVWAKFVLGYTRYAGAINVLSTILIIKGIIYGIRNQKVIMTMAATIVVATAVYMGSYQYFYHGSLYNYSLVEQGNLGINAKIDEDIAKVFNDRHNQKYDIDGVWGVINDDSGVPTLLNVDDRLIHLEYGFKTGQTDEVSQIYWDNVLNNEIYVPIYEYKLDGKLSYLDKYKFKIVGIDGVIEDATFLERDDTIYIVKVKYDEKVEEGDNQRIFERLVRNYN